MNRIVFLIGTITTNIRVDFMKVTDFYPLLTKTLTTKPDCILIGSSSEPDARQKLKTHKKEVSHEVLAKLRKTVTPAKAGVQNYLN